MRASFAPVGVAYCADGRRVGFTAPLHLGLRVGGLVVIEGAGGDADLVVQVREQQVVNREAMSVELDPDDDALGPGVAAATVRPMFRSVLGVGAPVARIVGDVAETATSAGPFGERRLRAATTDEARSVVDALDAGTATIEIGAIVAAEPATTTAPARLRTKGFARHTFMCGQSGSGKTSTTGVLFERLLSGSSLPLVVIDPNSDYIHLGTIADPTDDSDAAQRHRALARASPWRERAGRLRRTRCAPTSASSASTSRPSCCDSTRSPTWSSSPRCVRLPKATAVQRSGTSPSGRRRSPRARRWRRGSSTSGSIAGPSEGGTTRSRSARSTSPPTGAWCWTSAACRRRKSDRRLRWPCCVPDGPAGPTAGRC